jgi:hypothetical protein
VNKKNIYSIFDSKAEAYLDPFYAPTDGVAIRMFQQAANDASSDFHKFAADYTLFKIGEFDVAGGLVEPTKAHENLGTALQYVGAVAGE